MITKKVYAGETCFGVVEYETEDGSCVFVSNVGARYPFQGLKACEEWIKRHLPKGFRLT